MLKLAILLIAVLELGVSHTYAQKLFGYVVEQNSGKKPVPGVMVKARFANQTATTETGTFTLTFQNAKPGDNAVLIIEKEEWVIVEKSRLQVNLPADPFKFPHTIVICRASEWAKANQANYQLLDKMVRDALQKQKSQLNKQSLNYQKTIDSLENQFIKTQAHLYELTDALSRVNLDDVSETEKAAYAYFAEGKVDEAVLLRGTLQSEKNLLLATQRLKELGNKPNGYDTALISIHNLIALHRRNLREEINLAKLRLDWKTAEAKLKFLADNDNTEHENLLQYGKFLLSQHEFEKASDVYSACLETYRQLNTQNSGAFSSNLAAVLYDLGAIQKRKYQYKEAEASFNEALALYTRLNKDKGSLFTREVGETMAALATLHADKQLFRQAEDEFRKALNVIKPLEKININIYEEALAEIQANLARLYLNFKMYKPADSLLKASLNVLRRHDSLSVLSNQVLIAEIQNTLGNIYLLQDKNEAAEVVLQNALAVCRKYQKISPAVYDPLLSRVTGNLGTMYAKKADLGTYVINRDDSALARNYLGESRTAIMRLVDASMDIYSPDLAVSDEQLGFYFTEVNDRDSAELCYTEAATIYEYYATMVPEMFELASARLQRKLGSIYLWSSSVAANVVLNNALNIYKRYAALRPLEMEEEIARIRYEIVINDNNYDHVFSKEDNLNRQKKSLAQYKELQEIYTRLDKKSGGKFTGDLKNILASIERINKEIVRVQNLDPSIYSEITETEKAKRELEGLRYDVQEAKTNYHALILLKHLVQRKSELIKGGKFNNVVSLGHDYNDLAWYLLLSRKYAEAEQAALKALEPGVKKPADYDREIEYAKANLALALLLQNKYDEAKKIYGSLKDKSDADGRTFVSIFLDDMAELKKNGISHPDYDKIKAYLVE
ncbi:tetratricopeptide repeat protein [Flavitalea antarctica]